jgi:malonyl-CoA O-methyltransferase
MTFKLTPLDRHAVRASFDRAADSYDAHAVLQQEVGRRLLERVEYQRDPPRWVLDVGCGTGQAARALQERFPGAGVVALDWSTGMLRQVAVGAGAAAPKALCADMQNLPLASRSIDLVFSNLAAQWSPDPERLFAELRRVLRPGGLMLFSTFGPDTLIELRSAWSAADGGAHVNDFIDLHDLGDLLVGLGFAEPVMDMDLITLEYPDVRSMMRELKAIGARNSALDRRSGLTGKGRLRAMLAAYESFKRGDRYPATWEVIYGAAFGPAEGQPLRSAEGEVAEFSLEALRASRRAAKP